MGWNRSMVQCGVLNDLNSSLLCWSCLPEHPTKHPAPPRRSRGHITQPAPCSATHLVCHVGRQSLHAHHRHRHIRSHIPEYLVLKRSHPLAVQYGLTQCGKDCTVFVPSLVMQGSDGHVIVPRWRLVCHLLNPVRHLCYCLGQRSPSWMMPKHMGPLILFCSQHIANVLHIHVTALSCANIKRFKTSGWKVAEK